MKFSSHYKFIEHYSKQFSEKLNLPFEVEDLSCSDGDTVYGYTQLFKNNNISFNKGSMVYLLSKIPPYSSEVRDTVNGWVSVEDWFVKMINKPEIIEALNELKEDLD